MSFKVPLNPAHSMILCYLTQPVVLDKNQTSSLHLKGSFSPTSSTSIRTFLGTRPSSSNFFLVLSPRTQRRAWSAFAGVFEAVSHTLGGGGSCRVLASPWWWELVSRNS